MYKNDKSIAILLAVYNGEKYLREQLDSLLRQSVSDWSLYIRDDNSTDNTVGIIEEYCNKFTNIILVKDECGNLGCSGNFFQLLSIVDSKYYMFCDADDVWLENKIEISIDRIKEMELDSDYISKPLLVHTDKIVVDKDLNVMADSHWRSINLDPDKFMSYNLMGVYPCIGGATMLFNKRVKDVVFPVPEAVHLYDFWIALQVVKYGHISTIKIPTIKYRQHESNVCGVIVNTDKEYKIKNKLLGIFKKLNKYLELAEVRKKIGWGPLPKYFYYKLIVFFKLRF